MLHGRFGVRIGRLLRCNPALPEVKRVYSTNEQWLDQYLANRLTKGRFEVVTDPDKADAVFTDRIGNRFRRKVEGTVSTTASPEARAMRTHQRQEKMRR